MSFSFSFDKRVTKKSCFKKAYSSKKVLRIKPFRVHYVENNQDNARLGITVQKKNCKLAVNRNKIKRSLREGFRHNIKNFKNMDFVVVVKKEFVICSKKEQIEHINFLWKKLCHLNKKYA